MSVEALIIDDSPVARRIIRHHLEQIGCKVVGEADNGFQGLNLFRELKPNLVTLDLIMPTLHGFDASQVFQTIRKEYPGTKILVVSALPFEKTRKTLTEEGALAYIIKPFNRFSFDQARVRLLRVFPQLVER